MNEFEKFLEENNYKDDLEFQLCDLEVAFNAGKELQWKPSKEQMKALNTCIMQGEISYVGQGTELQSLYNDLKKFTE